MIELLIYLPFLILPPVLIRFMMRQRINKWLFSIVSFTLMLVFIPACLMLPLFPVGGLWPWNRQFAWAETRVSSTVQNYNVAVVQKPGIDFYDLYFVVTRPDGKQARFWIDGDANKCWWLRVRQVGSKVYFPCNNEVESRTSYVDIDTLHLYGGYLQTTTRITDLDFE